MKYRFEGFVLDRKRGLLTGPDGDVPLRPQVFELLALLVTEAPGVISRQRLIDEVWGTEHLCDTSLPRSVSELRRLLGDEARKPRFIETVHRRGYRFVGALDPASDEAPEPAVDVADEAPPAIAATEATPNDSAQVVSQSAPPPATGPPIRRIAASGLLILIVGLAAWLASNRQADSTATVGSAEPGSRATPLERLESEQWAELGLPVPHAGIEPTVEPGEAIRRLKIALEQEPESAAFRWHLARAWQEQGKMHEAQEAARRALADSEGLPWQARLMFSALDAELQGDRQRAVIRYASLHQKHPEVIGLSLIYSRALRLADRPIEARQLARRLADGLLAANPRVHLELAESCALLEEHRCLLEAAERAAVLTKSGGSPWLRARSADLLAYARVRTGSTGPVAPLFEQADQIFSGYGFNSRAVRVWQHQAEALILQQRLDEARLVAENVVGVSRRLDDRRGIGSGLLLVGQVQRLRSDLDDAETLLLQAADNFLAAGFLKGLASTRLELARVYGKTGRAEEAERLRRLALESFDELGIPSPGNDSVSSP